MKFVHELLSPTTFINYVVCIFDGEISAIIGEILLQSVWFCMNVVHAQTKLIKQIFDFTDCTDFNTDWFEIKDFKPML